MPGEGPDLGLDRHADLGGRVQAQEGVLGVRVVAALGDFGVGPAAGRPALAGLDLGRLEPGHVGGDPELVALGLGGGEDHGLQRDRVGAAELVGAEPAKMTRAPCGWRRIGFLARGQEGQGDQAGRPGLGLRR